MKGAGDMENINIILAANILKYRKKSGLSQEELAKKFRITISWLSSPHQPLISTRKNRAGLCVRYSELSVGLRILSL